MPWVSSLLDAYIRMKGVYLHCPFRSLDSVVLHLYIACWAFIGKGVINTDESYLE